MEMSAFSTLVLSVSSISLIVVKPGSASLTSFSLLPLTVDVIASLFSAFDGALKKELRPL